VARAAVERAVAGEVPTDELARRGGRRLGTRQAAARADLRVLTGEPLPIAGHPSSAARRARRRAERVPPPAGPRDRPRSRRQRDAAPLSHGDRCVYWTRHVRSIPPVLVRCRCRMAVRPFQYRARSLADRRPPARTRPARPAAAPYRPGSPRRLPNRGRGRAALRRVVHGHPQPPPLEAGRQRGIETDRGDGVGQQHRTGLRHAVSLPRPVSWSRSACLRRTRRPRNDRASSPALVLEGTARPGRRADRSADRP
jgi:hypothetical protein